MSEITSNTINGAFSEAPASWNTKYATPDGFVCQLTLRGESGKELLEKANAALSWLKENGFHPGDNNHWRSSNNSKGDNSKPQSNGGNGNNDENGTNLCPIHHIEMKRWDKDGRVWYSHKTESGWCTGKASK